MSEPVAEEAPAREVAVSGTLSFMDLFKPLVDVQIEGRLHPRVGLAGHAGYGFTRNLGTATLGAQGRFYVYGRFGGGTFLGVDANWLRLEESLDPAILWDGTSGTLGPVVGLKHAFDNGFTIEGHFGYGALIADGELAGGFFLNRVGIGWSL